MTPTPGRYRATSTNDYSFARRHRLCTAADFDRVFREGRRSADRLFTVLYAPNKLPHARIGFALSRKRIRSAVHRNRVRRIAREHFRHTRGGLPPCDLVIMAREATAGASSDDIRESLNRHWQRISHGHPARNSRDDG